MKTRKLSLTLWSLEMKFIFQIVIILFSYSSVAAQKIELHHNNIKSLQEFTINNFQNQTLKSFSSTKINKNKTAEKHNQLHSKSITKLSNSEIKRYQQYYKGLPVIGGQITIKNSDDVNGQLFSPINLNISPLISKKTLLARTELMQANGQNISNIKIELQIRFNTINKAELVYKLSFKKTFNNSRPPAKPVLLINANTGQLIKQWNNVKYFSDQGPGGNLKTNEYWYGLDGLPSLNVTKNKDLCTMSNNNVKLVNLIYKWDYGDFFMNAYSYPCQQNIEDNVNGAFSPINDAFYFGRVIIDMYKDWYNLNALQYPDGQNMQLVMRVHFGESYENAFWDGDVMSFGDGSDDFYPLVSLDVAGHEVSHGFTEQHSDLEYHDQSGAINESFSDMAGIASRAFLLQNNPLMHEKLYLGENTIDWDIGKTISKDNSSMRYMNQPSLDNGSADCLNKNIANANDENCSISYNDVIDFATTNIEDENTQQGYIVHKASGIFNKVFYLIATEIGVKEAFKIMLQANAKYWLATSDFKSAACDVLQASNDLNQDPDIIKNSFLKVGIDLQNCLLN